MADQQRHHAAEIELWSEFRRDHTTELREQLVALYDPLTRSIAARIYRLRRDDSVSFGDYLQYGRLGLIESLERFEMDRQVPFAAFCAPRIRGAILNGIARESEQSAQRRARSRRQHDRLESLSTAVAPDADRASLADIVSITMGLVVGLLLEGESHEKHSHAVHEPHDPYRINELSQVRQMLRESLDRLPEREREILIGHYMQEEEFQQIGIRLGISKSRVSQLHSRALLALRALLDTLPHVDRKL